MGAGTIYLVATPIGNLEDMSPRAIRILKEASVIAAEDTRHAGKLLKHFEIETPTISYHEHNEASRVPELIERAQQGESIALISDAGMPCISDPGARLVAAAHEARVPVIVIPGPSAFVSALAASGFSGGKSVFHGFFPRKASDANAILDEVRAYPAAHIFYESPKRLPATLRKIAREMPDALVSVSRELSKLHEETFRATAAELSEQIQDPVKGECVIIIDSRTLPAPAAPSDGELREHVRAIMEERGLTQRDAIRATAQELGIPKRRVYSVTVEPS